MNKKFTSNRSKNSGVSNSKATRQKKILSMKRRQTSKPAAYKISNKNKRVGLSRGVSTGRISKLKNTDRKHHPGLAKKKYVITQDPSLMKPVSSKNFQYNTPKDLRTSNNPEESNQQKKAAGKKSSDLRPIGKYGESVFERKKKQKSLFSPLKRNKKEKYTTILGTKKRSNQKFGTPKNIKKKLDKSLTKHSSLKKNPFRNKIKGMLIDKIGRDEEGELNIVGLILTIATLLPILIKVLVIAAIFGIIIAIIVAILSVVMAVWSFIASLFVVKTPNTMLESAYSYVSYLDARRNADIQKAYSLLQERSDIDKIEFYVNDLKSDYKKFSFSSDIDTYLYFINARYEEVEATKESRKDMRNLHSKSFSYTVTKEKKEESKIVVEGGEEVEKKVEKNVGVIDVEIKTIGQVLDENPDIVTEDEADRMYPIQELERFENMVSLTNPLGPDAYATVTQRYGYRNPISPKSGWPDSEISNWKQGQTSFSNLPKILNSSSSDEPWGTPAGGEIEPYIVIKAEPGTKVYSMGIKEKVRDKDIFWAWDDDYDERKGVDLRGIPTLTGDDLEIFYGNMDEIYVKEGQKLEPGTLIGTTKGDLYIFMKQWFRLKKNSYLYPAAYIDHLTFNYPNDMGYTAPSGGVTGNLISPPNQVLQWKELVTKYCKKNEIEEYINTILAIIWEESGGDSKKNPDIMNSGKRNGRKDLVIKTPEESIAAGTEYFSRLVKQIEDNNLPTKAVVQAYDYGPEYLEWLSDDKIAPSFTSSRIYASAKSKGKTVPYNNPIAYNLGYSWRYNHGNMFYEQLVTQHLTIDSDKMVEIAKTEIGNANGEKYWRWFGLGNRAEWSAIFISWLAEQTGYLKENRLIKTSSCKSMIEWLKEEGRYIDSSKEYVPQTGDLIFFDWNGKGTGQDHVGIVEYSDGQIIQTIEGNSENQVKRKTYPLKQASISGYGILKTEK